MENQTEIQPEIQPKTSFFQSSTAKMILVGILTLVLLIPLSLVQNLISERSLRQKEVVTETTSKWGGKIAFQGPILKILYTDPVTKKNNFAYFFPEELKANIQTTMEKPLERSIYKSNVFTSEMKFDGKFTKPNFESIPAENIHWNQSKIIIKTTNLKSLKDEVTINFNSKKLTFEPANTTSGDSIESLETNYFDYGSSQNDGNFKFDISFKGSQQIKVVPIGKTTSVTMNSNWNSPSFNGNHAPTTREVTEKGFKADWKILHFNRPFAQHYFGNLPSLYQHSLAVDFITPVDEYQQNERASKYGFLVIGLTFLIFFLIQSISKINIHIFQYSMIGIALIMFYTLLISITEHSSFSLAYAISGTSVIALISLYSISILKDRKFPLFIAISLTVLYTFIYVIIQLEDYALLVGSIGLFLILAAVMYFSRKIEWTK